MGCFYDRGLKFSCNGCRYCCGVEPGYVFLCEADIARLCAVLHMERGQVLSTYCRRTAESGFRYSLLEKTRNDCIFLTEKGCAVYEARPVQCRTYPFWDTIVKDRQSWEAEGAFCPGINHGKTHSKREIEEQMAMSMLRHMGVWE